MRFWQTALTFRSCAAFVIATTIVLGTTIKSRADIEPKRIMMLHSFGLRFKPWTDYAETIRSELSRKSKWPLDFHDHSLLNARLRDDQSDEPFVDYLHAIYRETPPDLIIAFGAPAASFVQRYRARLFPQTPMVFTAIEARRVQYDKLGENDTVVATHNDFAAAFESLLHVLPKTKTIAIVNGVSPNEKFWQGELQRELRPFGSRVELKWLTDMSFEDILKEAAHLPPHSAIFWHLMNVDAAGVAHEANTALNRLAASANAPIFSFLDVFFGEALLGGSMQSSQQGSELAASVALRILDGERAGDIKTPPTENAPPKYDWRQMQRWGVSEHDLPPGSVVFFKALSLWETYHWQVLAVCTLLLLQAILITLLTLERRHRHLAEAEARQRMSELARVNRFSMAGELTASIAHEINQPLAAIQTNAETMELALKARSPDIDEIKEIAADIRRDQERASEVIRRLRSMLRKVPFELRSIDLNEVVRETMAFLSALAIARQTDLRSFIDPAPLPTSGDRIQLQQVILNLIVNAMDATSDMPSAARRIAVRTRRVGGLAEVSISDAGPGIPPDKLKEVFEPFFTTKAQGMGMGLSIARTIVEAHNGRIFAENQTGGGAIFRITLPLAKSHADATDAQVKQEGQAA
jgi:signal transduction histidine kinase